MPEANRELANRPLAELARNLRDGTVTAAQITEAAIANHERRDPILRAYKAWDPDRMRKQAAAADAAFAAGFDMGPLQGIPVSVKDLFGVPGFRTCAGAPRELLYGAVWQ